MEWWMWTLLVIAILLLLLLLTIYICFILTFYVFRNNNKNKEEYPIPPGKVYEPHREEMIALMKEVRGFSYKEYSTTSFDGLRLHAKYYETIKGAPIEIMHHGYRGSAERDLCGGVQRAFAAKHNVLLIDQRTSGKSEGHVITFGINERYDTLSWVDLVIKEFGEEQKIIITGISMGAATVLMASELDLPNNVIGVIADCGYTSPKEIIIKCVKNLKLPSGLFYPLIKIGAKLFGHFNLEAASPINAIENTKLPVILFHGEDDDFVPCYMSVKLHEKAKTRIKLITVPKAGHGLSYLIEPELYIKELNEFFN